MIAEKDRATVLAAHEHFRRDGFPWRRLSYNCGPMSDSAIMRKLRVYLSSQSGLSGSNGQFSIAERLRSMQLLGRPSHHYSRSRSQQRGYRYLADIELHNLTAPGILFRSQT